MSEGETKWPSIEYGELQTVHYNFIDFILAIVFFRITAYVFFKSTCKYFKYMNYKYL